MAPARIPSRGVSKCAPDSSGTKENPPGIAPPAEREEKGMILATRFLTRLLSDKGQTLVEYGLIIGAVSLAIIAILIGLVGGGFQDVVDAVADAMT